MVPAIARPRVFHSAPGSNFVRPLAIAARLRRQRAERFTARCYARDQRIINALTQKKDDKDVAKDILAVSGQQIPPTPPKPQPESIRDYLNLLCLEPDPPYVRPSSLKLKGADGTTVVAHFGVDAKEAAAAGSCEIVDLLNPRTPKVRYSNLQIAMFSCILRAMHCHAIHSAVKFSIRSVLDAKPLIVCEGRYTSS